MLSLPVEVLSAGLTLSSRLPARGPMIHTVAERKQRSALMRQDGGGEYGFRRSCSRQVASTVSPVLNGNTLQITKGLPLIPKHKYTFPDSTCVKAK